ncbi:MAG TPA: CDP-alcohol phosphatidyltransferase family protein [Stellaceae bacterium]|jgi:phosphatidylglycerophosphate synthase|nr:CDP-alcohol phosphatidyltransferase family protein [Stellaceae bacterium]
MTSLVSLHPSSDIRRSAAPALAAAFCLQSILALGLLAAHAIGPAGALADSAVFGAGAAVLWRGLGQLADDRFGLANAVTLLRWTLIALLPGLILAARLPAYHPPSPPTGWAIVILGALTLGLDGVDGRIARRRGQATDFGARFDMEVDAAFVLGLSLLTWAAGLVPAWVLLSGALRYLWIGAGMAWAVLRRPLRPSRLRRSICAIQLGLLLGCLIPDLPHPSSILLAGLGLGLLAWSFSRDLVFLLRS